MEGVDAIFGLHCEPALPLGTIGLRSGAMTWASTLVRIELDGPLARPVIRPEPKLTTDLVRVLGEVATRLPDMVASHPSRDERPGWYSARSEPVRLRTSSLTPQSSAAR